MKKKFTRILGVALPLAMVLALAVALLPASTPAAEAGVGTLKFETIPLPKFNADGDWVLAPNTELGVIAVAPGGSVIFASSNTTSGSANVSSLLRSSDGGYTWTTLQNNFPLNQTTIVDIEVSPEYSSDSTIIVATEDYVWTSVDGGTIFTSDQPSGWGGTEDITDMDVILDEGGRLATIIGTTASSYGGDVYVQCPATTGSSWQAQAVGAASRNVLAVAFSLNFASDECIIAVTISAAATEMRLAFGSTRDGGGWGDAIGDAEFRDGLSAITTATRARIAFPDDYDVDSLTSNIAFVGLTTSSTPTVGDVFKVILETGTSSTAIDMNVRGLVGLQPTASDVWSIDASGDADAGAANVIVGLAAWSTATTPDTWLAYYSTDSGDNWYSARKKSPTGGDPTWSSGGLLDTGTGAECNVAMATDFATSGVAYAVTKGNGLDAWSHNAGTSAFSRTADGGKSWNQISLIDYSDIGGTWDGNETYYVNNMKAYIVYSSNPEIYMVTAIIRDTYGMGMVQSGGTLWKSANGGGTWERILSYANPSVTISIDSVATTGDATVFAKDRQNGKFWRSSDAGATFPRVVSKAARAGSLAVANVVDETSMQIVDSDGLIWTTSNLGRPWTAPDESIVEGHYATGYDKRGDIVLVGTTSGKVFISTDGGVTITDTLGRSDPASGYVIISFDDNYDNTHFVYATAGTYGEGIWRIELNEDDPGSTEWKRIDGDAVNLAAGAGSVVGYVGFQLGGVLYIFDYMGVDTAANTGGLWRCVNPTADIDGLYPPRFEKTQIGLTTGDAMGYLSYAVYPNTVFMKNGAHGNNPTSNTTDPYYNQVYAFGDVLSAPVNLVLPDDGATDVGVRLETIDLTMEVLAGWESVTSALSYEYQLALDEEFLSPIADQSATAQVGQQARFDNLPLGETYYWRVRVDSPLWSPWSAGRTFTVGTIEVDVPVVPFGIVSPELGASDVSIQPTFVWAEYEGATSYELVVAEDPTFAIIDWSRTSANTFYKAEEALAYSTTYAWKVRAAPDGPWATGIFTTEAAPVEPVAPIVTEPAAPAEIKIVEVPAAAPIPTYLLWIIIGVGAVLFIALIILIVRTRRVT